MRKLIHRLKSDEALMLAYQRGDSGAFECLYHRHKDALFAFVYRSCPRAAIAEELAGQAWQAVIDSAGRYAPTARYRTWLYAIAHRCMVDFRDRRDNRHTAPGSSLEPWGTNGDVLREEPVRRLMAAVSALPDEQRDALLLREQGFALVEIAEITGTGTETVDSRLRHAAGAAARAAGRAVVKSGTPRESLPLPSPRSPHSLDKRILAGARARMIPGGSARRAGWLGGLAAAGIAGVALLLWLSKPPPPASAPAAGAGRSGVAPVIPGLSPSPGRAMPPDTAPSPSAYFGRAAESPPQSDGEIELSTGVHASKSLDREEIQRSISACADLLAAGRSEDAGLCYLAFREVCADCGLPPTLEEVLGRPPGTGDGTRGG